PVQPTHHPHSLHYLHGNPAPESARAATERAERQRPSSGVSRGSCVGRRRGEDTGHHCTLRPRPEELSSSAPDDTRSSNMKLMRPFPELMPLLSRHGPRPEPVKDRAPILPGIRATRGGDIFL
ncbi:hypothetical protein H1C71_012004, partial [Ictidomys tridecemlineatus]